MTEQEKNQENNNEERLMAIEMKLAYLEDFMNQLQQVTVEHDLQMQKIATENKFLVAKLKEISDSLEGDIPNRKPPHY